MLDNLTLMQIGYDLELDKTVDGIKQLGRFGNDNMKIIDANEPLHNHTASENKIGFGLTFSKLLKFFKTEKYNFSSMLEESLCTKQLEQRR